MRKLILLLLLLPSLALAAEGAHYDAGPGASSLPLAGGTLTGPLLLPDGAVGAPALAFASDPDAGFYHANSSVWIGHGGTGLLRLQFGGEADLELQLNMNGNKIYDGSQALMLGTACTAPGGGTGDGCFGADVEIQGNLTVAGTISAAGTPAYKSFSTGVGNADEHYLGGWYIAPAAEAALNQGGATQTYGAANNSYASHAFIVAKEAGTATGGSGAVTITVSGISITDAGVRNGADTETIVADITALSTDLYVETSKKWLGQVTFTVDVGATGHTAYAANFNYGFDKYEDFGNRAFTLTDFECTWHAAQNETNFDLKIFHHSSSGWTWSAAAFVPGGTVVADLDTDHSTDDEFDNGEYGAYKRAALATAVDGSASEGVVIWMQHAVNNSIEILNCHVGATF